MRIDYISAVRPLCRAAANAKETDLQTIIFMNRNKLCIRFSYMNCTISVNTTTIAAEIPKMGGGIAMKATGIVRRIDDLGRVVIPKEIRRTLRIREGDPLQMTLAPWEKFCFAVNNLAKRNGWSSYIMMGNDVLTMRICKDIIESNWFLRLGAVRAI